MRVWPLFLIALLVQGCLPYGCSRIESRALLPADSLSRVLSAEMPVDTLDVVPVAIEHEMTYPRTVLFGSDGTLWLSDAGTNQVLGLGVDGALSVRDAGTLPVPYLIGEREGSPIVFSAEASAIAVVTTGGLRDRIALPPPPTVRQLQYATATDTSYWLKRAGSDSPGSLTEIGIDGSVLSQSDLPEPWWRWAGFLRVWEGEVVSLSGYRPFVYRHGAELDSLRLRGFDSPMLARSRSFLLGNVHQPPLLTASAAVLDGSLYVLNMRPGWLRIDVFDRNGLLRAAAVEPTPAFNTEFFPTDIAVRRVSDASVEIAVSVVEPEPGLRRYRWTRPLR